MSADGISFTLPIGFVDAKGKLQRGGKIRHVTAGDELEIQLYEKIAFNQRYRDLALLSKVITKLGDKDSVVPEDLEDLYEADFLYLQLLFNSLNRDDGAHARMSCPHCGVPVSVPMSDIFKNMMPRPADGEESLSTEAEMIEGESLA